MTASSTRAMPAVSTHPVVSGVAGGLAGGVLFGVLMQMMSMFPMVAALVGSTSAALGLVIHLGISAFIGATFGLLVGSRISTYTQGALLGMGYGVVWWALGALLLMPAKLGMAVFTFNTTAWQSLMGHVIYGLALGSVFTALARRDRS